ncbi:MAG: hypothetical protein ACTSPD_09775 [Promethearchaeota archaeon]
MSKLIVAKSNRGAPDPIGLHDSGGTIINPAIKEKQEEIITKLQSIFEAVDELEIKADSINLNTDDLEAKVQSIKDQLDVLLSTRASEATLVEIKNYVDTLETKVQTLIDKNQAQETGGNLESLNTKFGEVQTTPTQYTLLGRLKDIWDKLVELFNNGVAKVQLWDGTNTAEITSDNLLKASIYKIHGVVSTLNSTTVPLGINESFTGDFEEVLDYSHIIIQIVCDQDSVEDGLEIQWSNDGVNIDDDVFTIPANGGKVFTFGAQARYFRIKYTNGTVAQTIFRLTVILKPFIQKPSSHRLKDNVIEDDDAELVKSVLAGKTDAGIFTNVLVTDDGRLKVSQEPPTAPPETTLVTITDFSNIGGVVDTDWVIPAGETVTIQRLAGGAEPAGGSSIELYYDPDGTKTNLKIIDVIFSDGQSDQHVLNAVYTGDGTAQIVMRRTSLSNLSARLIFGRWEGYHV